MIDWDQVYKDYGFRTERQMWQTFLVSLRNNTTIGKYLGVSRGAVQRRRQILNIHQAPRRGATYRKAGKRAILDQLPEDTWNMPLEDILLYIRDHHDIEISLSYLSKYRRQLGL